MDVLIISISDELNGASKALFRIHNSLNRLKNVNSKMLVYKRVSGNKNVTELKLNYLQNLTFFFKKIINNYLVGALYPKKNSYTLFSHNYFSSNQIFNQLKKEKIDVLIVGWANSGIFNYHKIKTMDLPTLFVMEDMWYFTGGCHYNLKCENYKKVCSKCPVLNSSKSKDLSYFGQKSKLKIYNRNNIFFIAVSKWLKEKGDKSRLLDSKKIEYIPNTIDHFFFRKINYNPKIGKKLPSNKKIILFGATRAIDDKRKGLDYLLKALKLINNNKIILVIYGSDQKINNDKRIINYGKIKNDKTLINLLSAADLFVAPSIQEAFGLTVLEALSCSLPVVAFEGTGIDTQIDHKVNGYLAKYLDEKDLAKGIEWTLNHNKNNCLGKAAREKVKNEFSYEIVSQKYLDFFEKITNEKD